MKSGVYILIAAGGLKPPTSDTFLTGFTNNLSVRIREHNESKKGAHYTKTRRPVILAYFEQYKTFNEARKREAEIKKWRRGKRLNL